jgi:hypothetical protein
VAPRLEKLKLQARIETKGKYGQIFKEIHKLITVKKDIEQKIVWAISTN